MAEPVITTNKIDAGREGCQPDFLRAVRPLPAEHECIRDPMASKTNVAEKRRYALFTTLTKHIIMGFEFEEPCDYDQGMVKAMAELPDISLLCRAQSTTK